MTASAPVTVTEVGLRDGLQLEEVRLATADKARLIGALVDAGLRRIEVGSFVSPKAVPSMADTGAVLALLPRRPDVEYQVLVGNQRGVDDALAAGAGALNVVVAATETMNQRNVKRTVDESVEVLAEAVKRAGDVPVAAILAVAFRCPYEGPVDPARARVLAERLADSGAARVTLADTIGAADPDAVRQLVAAVRERRPGVELGFHGHDTRGLGVANVLAGVEAGLDGVDSSVGGLGGCPFAGRGASGNVASEEVVGLLDALGISSGITGGIDVDRLTAVAAELEELLGRLLPSRRLALYKATGSAR